MNSSSCPSLTSTTVLTFEQQMPQLFGSGLFQLSSYQPSQMTKPNCRIKKQPQCMKSICPNSSLGGAQTGSRVVGPTMRTINENSNNPLIPSVMVVVASVVDQWIRITRRFWVRFFPSIFSSVLRCCQRKYC